MMENVCKRFETCLFWIMRVVLSFTISNPDTVGLKVYFQVEGDRSLPLANEPAVWVPKKEYADPKDRPVAKASKSARKR